MKALIFSPYLHILGGGEQYIFQFGACLQKSGYQVTFVAKSLDILAKAHERFGIDTKEFKLIPYFPARLMLRRYDLTLVVSDGSVPFLPVGKSILLCMSPFVNVGGRNFWTQLKLRFIDKVLCFSHYTKSFIDKEFGVDSQLIYPAVVTKAKKVPKKNSILSVGRFTQTLHQKNQAALINAFIHIEKKVPEWHLVLAGGTEKGSASLFKQLGNLAFGHRITILKDISAAKLSTLYAEAKIYWHAAGFAADLKKEPEKAEHFGLSIVEAMANKVVPIVFAAGGPQEIVTPSSGFTWTIMAELEARTLALIKNDSQREKLAAAAKKRAQDFDLDTFCRHIYELVESITAK